MIRLEHLNKTYSMGEAAVHALRDVSLEIMAGEFVAIMGPSGSGKSTLLHVIGLLDQPEAGRIHLQGQEVGALSEDERAGLRSRVIGFVFQQFHLLNRTSAEANVAMPMIYSSGVPDLARARHELDQVGLANRKDHRPGQLSGGQQQRVAIARALINNPALVLADEPTGNLDSVSSKEIMELLLKLNRRGKTVLLVTHEADIAAYAGRVIHMRDGMIVQDEVRASSGFQIEAKRMPENELNSRVAWRARFSRGAGLVRQAFIQLCGNKVRSGLSMLGILIGVAAVIAMLALGAGAKEAIRQQFASLGSNVIILMPGARTQQGVSAQAGMVSRLAIDDADALKESVPSIARLAPLVDGRVQAVAGDENWNTQVTGTTPAYALVRASRPQVGRFIEDHDVATRARVAVVGLTVVRELFGNANPIGQFIRLNRVSFQVIGVLPEKGSNGWRDQDDVVIVPLTTAMYRLLGKDYVDNFQIEVASAGQIESAEEEIKAFMARRHRISGDPDEAFNIRNLAEIQAMMTATSRTMSSLLMTIAIISLIVGGIGIMNIMLVSVTERTREIGLRKAMGARRSDILMQFMTEAVVISVTGGLFGILLGWGVTLAMGSLLGWTMKVSFDSVALSFAFSAAIGVVFGLWPAKKAAELNPIDALRYE